MAIPEPANKRELRQFLGLANTLAKYTSEHQKRCSLLYKFVNHFTSKKAWTVEHSRLFLDIKKYLSNPKNVVFALDQSLPLALYTDASEVYGPGFSGILYNIPKDGQKLQPVCLDSVHIDPNKAFLHSTTLELGAIAWSLQKFHHVTAGAPLIKVYCDNSSTVKILQKNIALLSDPNHIKLVQIISRYNIQAHHIARGDNMHADLLSKHPSIPAS